MPEVADAWVSIYPKFSNGFASTISNEVKKSYSKGATSGGDAFTKEGKAQGRKFGDGFRSAIGPAMAAVSIAGLASFVKGATDAFSELEDATAAAGVVFGDNMDSIISQSENAATQMGMSKKQVIDAANTFGTYGKGAGLAGDALADFSEQMTQTAGDMASFKGGTPEEAIQAVGAALRGEAEPIRRYGVLLDDATLRAQALKMGLISSTKEALTPQNKVLAAQAEILRQTTDAQGDFARTSDSTANVAKTLAAESANLSAELGEKLAPAVTAAQKAGIGLLSWVSDNQAALVPLVGTLGTLTLAIGGFVAATKGIEALKAAKATVDALKVSFNEMSVASKAALTTAGAIGIALTAVSIGYGIWADASGKAKQQVEDLTQAIKLDSGALGENARAFAANALQKAGALDAAQKLGVGVDVAVSAALGEKAAIDQINEAYAARQKAIGEAAAAEENSRDGYLDSRAALTKLGDQYNILSGSVGGLQASTQQALSDQKQFEEAVGNTGTTAKNTAASASQLTDDLKGVNDAATDGKTAFDKYTDAINGTYQAQLTLRGDKRGLEGAIDDATASVKENGKTLDINTEKGRKNQDALDGVASAALGVVEGMKQAGEPTSKIATQMDTSRAAFIKTARSMGMSKEAAEKLAAKLGLIKSKSVTVDATVKPEIVGASKIVLKQTSAGTVKLGLLASGGKIPGQALHDRDDKVLLASGQHLGVPGEWVVNRKSSRYYGDAVMAAINAGRVPRDRLTGYADGGKIGQPVAGGPSVQISITQNNPVAQPAAVIVNQALQYAAALGV